MLVLHMGCCVTSQKTVKFSSKIRNETDMPDLTSISSQVLEVSALTIRWKNSDKKKFADNIVLYIKYPKNSTVKQWTSILSNQYEKVCCIFRCNLNF